ncbi:MAG: hypothetical protein WA691_08925 [Thermoplasmata archaeon]
MAAVYLYVGYRIADRRVSPTSRLASIQFALWWGGLGASVGLGGIELLLALSGAFPYALAMTTELVGVIVDCTFLWGLTGFLTYVYTGRYHLFEVSLLYIGFYIAYLYWFFAQSPTVEVFVAAQPMWHYAASPNVPLELILVIVLVGPELVGAILYLSLRFRTRDTAQRYRIGLVGGGILLWFAVDLFIPATSIPLLIARTLFLVIPGLMSLIAFYPPEWARRKYGVTSFDTHLVEGREAAPNP